MEFARFTAKWLNPKLYKVPVVIVDAAGGGFGGGANNVVAFVKGWNRQPVLQSFTYAGNSIGSFGQSFDAVDERGLLKMTEAIYQYSDNEEFIKSGKSKQIKYYYWQGDGFFVRD